MYVSPKQSLLLLTFLFYCFILLNFNLETVCILGPYISFLFEQASDPSEPSLSSEFRTQTQTEFLLEAFRLQQGASETGQKLMALQTEIGKSLYRDELKSEATPTTRRSLDSIRNNFKDLQRNLEIWLARIIGDLEGILARDGASRVREYYISRYPFVQ